MEGQGLLWGVVIGLFLWLIGLAIVMPWIEIAVDLWLP